jgi:hypothetical protein
MTPNAVQSETVMRSGGLPCRGFVIGEPLVGQAQGSACLRVSATR